MKSYIKIMGPPLIKAVKELEKIAIDIPEVCVMDEAILHNFPNIIARDIGEPVKYTSNVDNFFYPRTGVRVKTERCNSIISKSGEELGEYDFIFEWFKEPDIEQLYRLIGEIDRVLEPLGCFYSFTTKRGS